jgi:hypothetical protein
MDPWTSNDRELFIQHATNTQDNRGHKGYYQFATFPKVSGTETENVRKSLLTEAFAKTIYEKNPNYRKISLGFYDTLIHKLSMNPYTGPHLGNNIMVLMKGSNAYAYITAEQFKDDFKFSDMDIVIYINPYISSNLFTELEKVVKVTVLQTLSQYKRLLDHMFFINKKQIDGMICDDETINAFKEDYKNVLKEIPLPANCEFISPFESDEDRNYCSKNSCILTNSKVKDNMIVRIDVPHYERCERIPLRKTPFFCSYNETIDFARNESGTMHGNFDLYRIRFNNMYIEKNENGEIINKERVVSDFIDVSIAGKTDNELLDFWTKGRCLSIYDKFANVWIMVPDITSCIEDLYKMLNVYECPEGKKMKRQQKMIRLIEIMNSYATPYIYTKTPQVEAELGWQ